MKKWISAVLVTAMLLALLLPVGAASVSFTDIPDVQTQKNAAVLQMMGVMDGTGGANFSPNGTLTRAQFCKMTVQIMGRGDEEPLYRNRTVFPDVRSGHWARGYVNLAVSIHIGGDGKDDKGTQLIRGNSNGTFAPDRAITYAEAVTILIRVLGYADADAGMIWPKGYLELGAKVGLTKGLNLSAGQSLTRAQAAQLFVAMLKTPQKGGNAFYNTLGTVKNDVVLLRADATAEDGTPGALGTSDGVYKTVSGVIPASLVGSRGTLVTNTAGKAVVFIPVGEQKSLVLSAAQAGWVTDAGGVKYTVPTAAPTYSAAGTSSYDKIWMDLRGGGQVTLFYAADGKVNGLYVGGGKADTAMVAKEVGGGNPFEAILNGVTDYTIYRDGSKATAADLCLYDVGTYDPAMRVLSVSSGKLSGSYENVWPNLQSPSKITVLGKELSVLPMAMDDLAAYKLGQNLTLLLTTDLQVAGVIPATVNQDGNIGVVVKNGAGTAEVKLLSGLNVLGKTADETVLPGELVRVTSAGTGRIGLSRLSGSGAGGKFDVTARKVGAIDLAPSCRFFEKVGKSGMKEISIEALTRTAVPSAEIQYVHKNSGGKVDVIVFNNATGDLFTYGLLMRGDMNGNNYTVTVKNAASPDGGAALLSNAGFTADAPGGVVASADGVMMEQVITLQSEASLKRSAFTTRGEFTYASLRTQEMRVADNVQCFNKVTGTWFKSLADARAFSDNLTVYYDRSVADGGKIRLVVAN